MKIGNYSIPSIPLKRFLKNLPNINLPNNFVDHFNHDPVETMNGLIHDFPAMSDIMECSHMLFYLSNISPFAVSKWFFADQSCSYYRLFHFFSSIRLDYMHIADAARLLLSKIGFPLESDKKAIIFKAFAAAFKDSNTYYDIDLAQIAQVASLSIFQQLSENFSLQEYKTQINNVQIPEQEKENNYRIIQENPFPVYFLSSVVSGSFTIDDFTLSAKFKKSKGILSNKDKTYKLNGSSIMSIYLGSSTTPMHMIDLSGVQIEIISGTKGQKHYLHLFRNDKPLYDRRSELNLYPIHQDEDLQIWVTAVHFYNHQKSFYLLSEQMQKQGHF